jgi:hypothetical protein
MERIFILLTFSGLFFAALISPVLAETNVDPADSKQMIVSSITPVYVERGATTYMVTLRAHVTNNGVSENISVDVTGKDDDGYILQNIRFTGVVKPGGQRMLMERFQIRGDIYEKISSWEVRQ